MSPVVIHQQDDDTFSVTKCVSEYVTKDVTNMILENLRARKIRYSQSKLARYISILRWDSRFRWGLSDYNEEVIRERVKRNYNHMCSCSCHLCGNPRKHFKIQTTQERRADMFAKSQFEDFGVFWRGSRFRNW